MLHQGRKGEKYFSPILSVPLSPRDRKFREPHQDPPLIPRGVTTNSSLQLLFPTSFEDFGIFVSIPHIQIMANHESLADEPHNTFDTILTLDFGSVTPTRLSEAVNRVVSNKNIDPNILT